MAYTYPAGNFVEHDVLGVDAAVWNELHVGQALPVKYLSANPGVNRIDLPLEDLE